MSNAYVNLGTEERLAVDAAAKRAIQERFRDSGIAGIEGYLDQVKEAIASDPEKLEAAIAASNEGRRI